MISDAITALGQLVPPSIPVGASAGDAVASVTAEIERNVIPASRLVFGSAVASTGVRGAVLLCDASTLKVSLPQALALLSGAGDRYSGLFDEALPVLSPECASALHGASSDPAPLERRIPICVRLLSLPAGTLPAAIAKAVRAHLSSILLDHPVLLHPSLLIPTSWSGRIEYQGIAAALAMSTHGGLPRYSDFHPNAHPGAFEGLEDQGLVSRLLAFSRHPCVRLALAGPGFRISSDAPPDAYRCEPVISRDNLVRSMFRSIGPRAQFLGSVMETDELAFPRLRGSDASLPFVSSIYESQRFASQLAALLAQSAIAACGAAHSAAERGTPGWSPYFERDSWFLEKIRSRGLDLVSRRTAGGIEGHFHRHLMASAQRRIFLAPGAGMPTAILATSAAAIAEGLVRMGVASSSEAASDLLLDWTIGAQRPEGQLPRTDVSGAIAFLKALESSPARLTAAPAVEHLASLLGQITSLDSQRTPAANDWSHALEIVIAERRMAIMLNGDRVSAEQTAPESRAPREPALRP